MRRRRRRRQLARTASAAERRSWSGTARGAKASKREGKKSRVSVEFSSLNSPSSSQAARSKPHDSFSKQRPPLARLSLPRRRRRRSLARAERPMRSVLWRNSRAAQRAAPMRSLLRTARFRSALHRSSPTPPPTLEEAASTRSRLERAASSSQSGRSLCSELASQRDLILGKARAPSRESDPLKLGSKEKYPRRLE